MKLQVEWMTCRGRGDELQLLMRRVLGQPRSYTMQQPNVEESQRVHPRSRANVMERWNKH